MIVDLSPRVLDRAWSFVLLFSLTLGLRFRPRAMVSLDDPAGFCAHRPARCWCCRSRKIATMARITRTSVLEILVPRIRPHRPRNGWSEFGASARAQESALPIATVIRLKLGKSAQRDGDRRIIFTIRGIGNLLNQTGSKAATTSWCRR